MKTTDTMRKNAIQLTIFALLGSVLVFVRPSDAEPSGLEPGEVELTFTATPFTWVARTDQPGAGFGFSGGTAGDVNGDSYTDLIVGAPFYQIAGTNVGRVYVYYLNIARKSRNIHFSSMLTRHWRKDVALGG
ncbi:MAG: integrin alpha [Verrucomicrobia bacterium]|nr:integrin alpha [Verrucomicrobiota bacterium]MBU4429804.1 integrin alpha [Verrucomicrobiota bacterium]MBU4497467.1 integrin alpha [Verrucomicrobiota bacterium]MCG2681686.1 integrin alpha [Kiritimatiellia bacterium]